MSSFQLPSTSKRPASFQTLSPSEREAKRRGKYEKTVTKAFFNFLNGTPNSTSKKSSKELLEELNQAKNGTHPLLVKAREESKRKTDEFLDRLRISEDLTMNRIKREFDKREQEISESENKKLVELYCEIEKHNDMLEKKMESEYGSLEINKPAITVQIEPNKKTLRGHGGVIIEPPTYFNAYPKTQVQTYKNKFLLSEEEIAEDLAILCPTMPKKKENKEKNKSYEAHLQKLKFSYDGKTYKQGEEVYVENAEYGKLTAKAENVTESVIYFRASQPWDTRQIHASHSDLVEGRVKVYKKKNN